MVYTLYSLALLMVIKGLTATEKWIESLLGCSIVLAGSLLISKLGLFTQQSSNRPLLVQGLQPR